MIDDILSGIPAFDEVNWVRLPGEEEIFVEDASEVCVSGDGVLRRRESLRERARCGLVVAAGAPVGTSAFDPTITFFRGDAW